MTQEELKDIGVKTAAMLHSLGVEHMVLAIGDGHCMVLLDNDCVEFVREVGQRLSNPVRVGSVDPGMN